MKKILCTLLLMAVCSLSFAQYVRQGNTIIADGQMNDKAGTIALLNQAGGSELATEWYSAVSRKGWGIGLTAGGFTVMTLGLATSAYAAMVGGVMGGVFGGATSLITGYPQDPDANVSAGVKAASPVIIGGLVAAGVGLAAGIVGIVQIGKAKKTMNAIVDGLNNGQYATTFTVGATPNGVGLAVNF